jgi:S-DNA-T family DNA segregation ATPase FtsK/SpoIIIE
MSSSRNDAGSNGAFKPNARRKPDQKGAVYENTGYPSDTVNYQPPQLDDEPEIRDLGAELDRKFRRNLRIAAILMILISVFVLIAMISYSPRDEVYTEISVNDVSSLFHGDHAVKAKMESVRNYLGITGAILSNWIYNKTIGYFAIIIPFLLIWGGVLLFRKYNIEYDNLRKAFYLLIAAVFGASLMGSLGMTDSYATLPKEWSGTVGRFLPVIASAFIGKAGSFIISLLAFMACILTGFRMDPRRIVPLSQEIARKTVSAYNHVKNSKIAGIFSKNKIETNIADTQPENNNNFENDLEEPARIIRRNLAYQYPMNYTPSSALEDMENDEQAVMGGRAANESRQAASDSYNPSDDSYEPVIDKQQDNNTETIKPSPVLPNLIINKPSNLPVIEKIIVEEKRYVDYHDETEINKDQQPEAKIHEEVLPDKEVINTALPARQVSEPVIEATSIPVRIEPVINNRIEEPVYVKPLPQPVNPLSSSIHDEEINYTPPHLGLLNVGEEEKYIDDAELRMNAQILQEKLETFKISIENLAATPGPVVTQYEFVPAAGIKISRIESLADDIAMALKAKGIRIIAPIPGKGTVGVEIPNTHPSTVHFSSIIKSPKFHTGGHKLPIALGKTINGELFVTDLAKMPHLLIAGATGSGKSVGINTVIASLLYKMHPSNLKFVIVDPKKVELRQYRILEKHFLAVSPDLNDTIITDPQDAIVVLKSVCAEMDLRYDILAKVGQRNITEYNQKIAEGKFKDDPDIVHKKMPYIVVIIDELADLMLTAQKEVETPIIRIAQLARAVGIHCIVATQRPSVDVITGIIKANFPARMAYLVASKVDSRTILDSSGADQLLGNGDMLFLAGGTPKPIRIQNAFISTDEVEAMCEFIGNQKGYSQPYYLPSLNESGKNCSTISKEDRDPLFEEAARIVIQHQQASVSLIQRRLKVGYARAGRIVDELDSAGVIGPFDGSKPRQVYMSDEDELEEIL